METDSWAEWLWGVWCIGSTIAVAIFVLAVVAGDVARMLGFR